MYLSADILEELLLKVPLKSLCRFKSVSKEWKSILDSKCFVERHLSLAKSGRKVLLAAYHCNCCVLPSRILHKSRFKGGEEFLFLHCDKTRPSMSYDGLVCIPEAECVSVLNPSTGQLWRFHSPSLKNPFLNPTFPNRSWSTYFPGYCAMGFGRDRVKGNYKVVRMLRAPNYCDILDVNTGEWRKLWKPSRFKVDVGRKSACVNGSIYWLRIKRHDIYTILALDLDKLEFHDVKRPPLPNGMIMFETQIVNIGDRLAIAMAQPSLVQLEIWSMEAQEETWNKTHSISLASLGLVGSRSFTPVTISKQGDVVFYDDKKRLFKFYPETDKVQRLFKDICVISPYLENMVLVQTQQGEFRSGITCTKTMDAVRRRVSECLYKEIVAIGSWLWKNKIKLFASYLLAYFLCYYFRTRNTVFCATNLTLVCWLTRAGYADTGIIKTIVALKIYDILRDLGFFGELA